jgi:nitroimidazol reductase NimA-like FMN-containing flavoprotein (pyridoxamine 5'-phosphate oxidase superfamily)
MDVDIGRSVQTWSIHLDEEQSRRLLASTAIGRLGVVVKGRPEIFPVAHVYDEASGCVLFPSRAGTKLDACLDWPWVAFEADGLDLDEQRGWSVLVVGRAEEVTDAEAIARARAERRVPWAAGPAARWLRIVPAKVTGREIRGVPRESRDRHQQHG